MPTWSASNLGLHGLDCTSDPVVSSHHEDTPEATFSVDKHEADASCRARWLQADMRTGVEAGLRGEWHLREDDVASCLTVLVEKLARLEFIFTCKALFCRWRIASADIWTSHRREIRDFYSSKDEPTTL